MPFNEPKDLENKQKPYSMEHPPPFCPKNVPFITKIPASTQLLQIALLHGCDILLLAEARRAAEEMVPA